MKVIFFNISIIVLSIIIIFIITFLKRYMSNQGKTPTFWETQPVERETGSNTFPISLEHIDLSLELVAWRDISCNREMVNEIIEFLSNNYLKTDECHYNATDFVEHMDNSSYIMYGSGEGIITSREIVFESEFEKRNIHYVDFLCISKNMRSKYIAPKYIQTFALKMRERGIEQFLFKKEGIPLPKLKPWKSEKWVCKYLEKTKSFNNTNNTSGNYSYVIRETDERMIGFNELSLDHILILKETPVKFKNINHKTYELYGMINGEDIITLKPGVYCGPKSILDLFDGKIITEYQVSYYVYNELLSREISEYTWLLL